MKSKLGAVMLRRQWLGVRKVCELVLSREIGSISPSRPGIARSLSIFWQYFLHAQLPSFATKKSVEPRNCRGTLTNRTADALH